MDSGSENSFQELFSHLAEVESDPVGNHLDIDTLRDATNRLGSGTSRDVIWAVLANGERLLSVLQEEPRPLTRLLEKDISLIPFDEIKDSISPLKIEEGLKSPSPSIQLLCLAYLRKAGDTPSGAAWVGSNSSLVKCLVTTWLASESTEVTERALEVIMVLLEVDHMTKTTVVEEKGRRGDAQGQGLLWRRLFRDSDTYSLFFYWTSFNSAEYAIKSKKVLDKVTISQARLFDFIARVAELDWSDVTHSHFPEIEAKYTTETTTDSSRRASLLQYAASGMIDVTDPLMGVLRREFFVKLLGTVEEGSGKQEIPTKLLLEMREDVGEEIESLQQSSAGMHL